VTDNLGRTALRLAVVNENLEVVASLLSKTESQKLREALLLAIYIGHTQIAELILRHPQYKIFNDKKLLNGASDSFWQTPSSDDAQFSPDITPIMLASQYNRTEIVQMLLLNGDRIDKPHEYNCKCNECTNRFKFDSLRHAQSRLNAYRALASESYISLVSVDPILTAFEMGHELRYLSEKEKYFKVELLCLFVSLFILLIYTIVLE
jgi:ankyrin repeat protein